MKALGAVFGVKYGWERPNWFAPAGYGLEAVDLAKPDTLVNENHPKVAEGERPSAGKPAPKTPPADTVRAGPSAKAVQDLLAKWKTEAASGRDWSKELKERQEMQGSDPSKDEKKDEKK